MANTTIHDRVNKTNKWSRCIVYFQIEATMRNKNLQNSYSVRFFEKCIAHFFSLIRCLHVVSKHSKISLALVKHTSIIYMHEPHTHVIVSLTLFHSQAYKTLSINHNKFPHTTFCYLGTSPACIMASSLLARSIANALS